MKPQKEKPRTIDDLEAYDELRQRESEQAIEDRKPDVPKEDTDET